MVEYAVAAMLGAGLGAAACWWVLRRRDALLERYFSFMAHELNTQVTGLQLTVENLLSGVFGTLTDEHRKWITAIDNRVDLLGCMVGDLRDVSHWDFGGAVRMILEPTSLWEAVDREVKRLANTAARSKVTLDVNVPPDLPLVLADNYRLKRVISGILHNALKFADSGSTMTLQARLYERKIILQVSYKPVERIPDPQKMLDMHYSVIQKGSALVSVGAGLGVGARVMAEMGGAMEIAPAERGFLTLTCLFPIDPGTP